MTTRPTTTNPTTPTRTRPSPPDRDRPSAPTLASARQILPGRWLLTWDAPRIAVAARPGQYVHVRGGGPSAFVVRHPFPINTVERGSGTLTLHVSEDEGGAEWLLHGGVGSSAELVGPLGRGFELDPRSRHLLLVAAGDGIASVRLLMDDALAEGRQVTLLYGAATAADVYPSSLIPAEVEYAVATADGSLGHRGSVIDLVPAYEAWADQAFAAGPMELLAAVAKLAAGRRARLGVARLGRKTGGRSVPMGSPAARRKAWLQVCVDQLMGCALGTCLGCTLNGTDGSLRACRDGPVFSSDELAWTWAE